MFLTFLRESIRFSTVFLYGSTGETITQKSGHLNLGTPGIMCIGAIGGSLGELWYIKSLSDLSQMNGFLAVLIPILTTLLFSGLAGLLFSFFTVTLRCNQNVVGLTITTFGVGLNKFVLGNMDNTGFGEAWKYFIKSFPCANDNWFTQLFFSYGTLVYLALIIAIIVTIVFKKTRVGLTLRAVGENPATADAAGINVTKYRYISTIIGCAVSGLGGLFYIMDYNGGSVWLARSCACHFLSMEAQLGYSRFNIVQSAVFCAELLFGVNNGNERVYQNSSVHCYNRRSDCHQHDKQA